MQFIANAWDKNAMIELTSSWRLSLSLGIAAFCSALSNRCLSSSSLLFFRRNAFCTQLLTYLLYISVQLVLFHRFNYLICTFFFILRFIWTFCPFCFSCCYVMLSVCFFSVRIHVQREHTSHTFYKCTFVSIKITNIRKRREHIAKMCIRKIESFFFVEVFFSAVALLWDILNFRICSFFDE